MGCGGEVLGEWVVRSSCLTVDGTLNLVPIGLGCNEAPISGELEVSGSMSFVDSTVVEDKTRTTGTLEFQLASTCLDISGTVVTCDNVSTPFRSFGFEKVDCKKAPAGGCDCSATVNQEGGMGHVSFDIASKSHYSTSGDTLKISDLSERSYSYCASDSALIFTPTTPNSVGETHGTVVLGPAH
jgi:hypothetical protein